MGTNMYPSSTLLGENKDGGLGAIPIDELIEKADGFAGVFPGAYSIRAYNIDNVSHYSKFVMISLVYLLTQNTSMRLFEDYKKENTSVD